MRILLLVHGFNSLSQRLFVELHRDGHELSVEFDIHDRRHLRGRCAVPPGRIRGAVPEARHPGIGMAARPLSHRAPRTARRSRPGGARLGHSARRQALGRYGPAGQAEFDAGPGLGQRRSLRCAARARAACIATR